MKIVVDSTCDLSRELLQKYDITVIPLHVTMGKREYADGVDINQEEIFSWSEKNKATPKTSAPSIFEVVQIFEKLLRQDDEIICLSVSEHLSSSGNVMKLAARELDLEDRIHVVDSANLSTGVGMLVIKAAQMAGNGSRAEEIVEELEKRKQLVRSSFVVDTLTYLYRGGRCSGVAAFAAAGLKLHPRINVVDGKMEVGKKYRGSEGAVILKYVNDLEADLRKADPERVFITHAGCSEELLMQVKNYLESLDVFEEICITKAGSVISSHCGPGTLGVLFLAN